MDEPFQNSNPEIENFTHLKVDKYLDFTYIKHKILQHQFVNYNSFRIEENINYLIHTHYFKYVFYFITKECIILNDVKNKLKKL